MGGENHPHGVPGILEWLDQLVDAAAYLVSTTPKPKPVEKPEDKK